MMLLNDAIDLIRYDYPKNGSQTWADLGCGTGLFTFALANLLDKGAVIHALDSRQILLKQEFNPQQVLIRQHELDFVNDQLDLPQLDGVLMANSLHYVSNKPAFLTKLKFHLKPNARLLIVEYDTMSANQWVPYPIDFNTLKLLMATIGFTNPIKLNERPSAFGKRNIYSAISAVKN
jgi:ubiquinone/menaquinone biosynthesis C-methylase UbiE